MPVGERLIAVHEELKDDLGLISKDPYGEGWLIKLKPANPKTI